VSAQIDEIILGTICIMPFVAVCLIGVSLLLADASVKEAPHE